MSGCIIMLIISGIVGLIVCSIANIYQCQYDWRKMLGQQAFFPPNVACMLHLFLIKQNTGSPFYQHPQNPIFFLSTIHYVQNT